METAHPDAIKPGTAPQATGSERAKGKVIWRFARSVVLIYVMVCVGIGCLQDRLIFPGAASQGQPTAVVSASSQHELIELRTRDGDKTFAVFGRAFDTDRRATDLETARTLPTAVLFYGNGDFLANALGWVSYFRELGVNVLAVEYVGYGMAEGKPSERAFYATADAAYDHLIARGDIDPTRIVPIGISIGCGPAVDLAVRRPSSGVVCFSPFTSLTDMGRHAMPFLPTSLLLKYSFDNQTKLAGYDKPVFITHGRRDGVIPFRMSQQLSKTAGGPVVFVAVDQADHNNLLEVGFDEITPALRQFFASLK